MQRDTRAPLQPADILQPGEIGPPGTRRTLAETFHAVLAEESLDALLRRVADTVGHLVDHDALTVLWADEARQVLVPVLARDPYAAEILSSSFDFGRGVTGWALERRKPVRVRDLHLDPRAEEVPGTPPGEPEALVTVPLVARGRAKGALNVYRLGTDAAFDDHEFELLARFGDAVALALDNAEIRERLERQAQTDSLTGLLNHREFHERLRAELDRSVQAGLPLALMMLDIDDFKRLNDVHGHAVGDETLVALARLLRSSFRPGDAVCRLGGEEFAVILPGVGTQEARGIASRIVREVAASSLGAAGGVTVSIGLACTPEHAGSARELVACSEAAMMAGKARGKNGWVVFESPSMPRPSGSEPGRDVRSLGHLRIAQGLVARLGRLRGSEQIGSALLDEVTALVGCETAHLYLLEGDELVLAASRGDTTAEIAETNGPIGHRVGIGVIGRAAATGRSVLVPAPLSGQGKQDESQAPPVRESMVATPLLSSGRVIGVILLSRLARSRFAEHDAQLLDMLAGHAGAALENARLVEAARREANHLAGALIHTVEVLAGAEAGGGPARELADLAVALGASLRLDPTRLLDLRLAALFLVTRSVSPGSAAAVLADHVLDGVPELDGVRSLVSAWSAPTGAGNRPASHEARILRACMAHLSPCPARPDDTDPEIGSALAALLSGQSAQAA